MTRNRSRALKQTIIHRIRTDGEQAEVSISVAWEQSLSADYTVTCRLVGAAHRTVWTVA